MEDGIIYNNFGHQPKSDLSVKIVDVFFNRDLFSDHVVGDVRDTDQMWRVLQELHVDPGGE